MTIATLSWLHNVGIHLVNEFHFIDDPSFDINHSQLHKVCQRVPETQRRQSGWHTEQQQSSQPLCNNTQHVWMHAGLPLYPLLQVTCPPARGMAMANLASLCMKTLSLLDWYIGLVIRKKVQKIYRLQAGSNNYVYIGVHVHLKPASKLSTRQ